MGNLEPRFVIEKEGKALFAGERVSGVSGLVMGILAHGSDLSGTVLFCDRVTQPMSRLIVYAGIQLVEAARCAPAALELLRANGIAVVTDLVAANPEQAAFTDDRMSELSALYENASMFLQIVKVRILGILSYNLWPSDELVVADLPVRLGYAGGGT